MNKKIALILLTILLISCSPTPEQIQAAINLTLTAQPTTTFTATNFPTNTVTVTNTAKPSLTPKPTNTPKPTETSTPVPMPIIITGETDSVVDIDKWNGPALAHIIYSGKSNFIIINYGLNNEKYNLLVNTIGNYEGTVPIDFIDSEQTKRFEVKASGPWEISIKPLTEIRKEKIPGIISGSGDDVIYLNGSNPDLMIIDGTNAKSNFIIRGYGNSRYLLVNEISPYSGTVILNNDIFILEVIEGGGNWTLEITTD